MAVQDSAVQDSAVPVSEDVAVLVVGGGPAGLAAAVELASLTVPVLLVERRVEPLRLPRATVISTRSMEVVRSWGLQDRVLAGGVDVEWKLRVIETAARAAEGTSYDVGYPSREESALISPVAPACVPQDHLERVLLGHLRSLPSARVDLGTELVGLEGRSDGVRVELRAVGSTAMQHRQARYVQARYVVAADGARSTIRSAVGVQMRGEEDLLGAATVQFTAPLWAVLGPYRYGIYAVTHPEGAGTLLPAGPGDRWLFGRSGDHLAGGTLDLTATEAVRLIRTAAGVPGLPVQIERIGTFQSAAQVAERFRAGNVFLAGDAAHRVTPRGGTGMNTALQDGYDIGWKLGWVLRGWAGAGLLDSYELERRPVAEHNVARSADPDGSRRSVGSELRADVGGRIAHHWLPGRLERDTSTLDLLGPGLTLFTGPDHAGWVPAAARTGELVPVGVRPLDQLTARALGVPPVGALLVRPDGAPAGLLARATSGLRGAIRSVTAPLAVRQEEPDREPHLSHFP